MTDPWQPPTPPPEWSPSQVTRWNDMRSHVSTKFTRRLERDPWVQILYNLAFNTPRGEITGDVRASTINFFEAYMRKNYKVELRDIFNWASWRDEYGGQ